MKKVYSLVGRRSVAQILQRINIMHPVVLFPDRRSNLKGNLEFDCDCACSLAPVSNSQNPRELSKDTFLRTCRPIHIQALLPDYDLVLSPSCNTTLAVLNKPARQVLDFFYGIFRWCHWDPQEPRCYRANHHPFR